MRIALDAMGGDRGPEELVSGALLAVRDTDVEVALVGDETVLRSVLRGKGVAEGPRLAVVHASQIVEMSENAVDAIRKKKDSSVLVACDLVARGETAAVVSAGHSGATLAAAMRKLGRLEGVSRPGLASFFPTLKKPVVLMDIGGNVDCRPHHLLQFAIMAAAFSSIHQRENPRIGLLTIGEEAGKGNALIRETYPLLAKSSLNFIGNIEGRDIFQGDVDVVVCDGFVGNVCLKISEGLAEAAMRMIGDEIRESLWTKLGYLLVKPAFRAFKKRVDYSEYGGAPILGIDGVGLVCHGKSDAVAIKNAILVANKMVTGGVNERIRREISGVPVSETDDE
ncbi:MAG TPA: phosphate acyltransferase PlsX [Desulfobulbaceae bacterium]|nr:phosphate acyltransferase PlsX [Desulfobulbaceae bacterium]